MSKLETKTSEEIANQLREIFHRYLKHETTDNHADYVNAKAERWVCEADLKQQLQDILDHEYPDSWSRCVVAQTKLAKVEHFLKLLDGGQK